MTTDQRTCNTCIHWHRHGENPQGDCRRSPPAVIGIPVETQTAPATRLLAPGSNDGWIELPPQRTVTLEMRVAYPVLPGDFPACGQHMTNDAWAFMGGLSVNDVRKTRDA